MPASRLFALFLALAPAGASCQSTTETDAGTWQQKQFKSQAVGGDATYSIFLPKSYGEDKEKVYPLVIWLHGLWETDRRFVSRGGSDTLSALMAAGEIPEMVFVCAHDGTRRSFYVNTEKRRYEDLVTKDLLAHLTKTYRVSKRRDQRAIMGISMGGMGALKIALKNPELFGTVSAHSSAVLPPDPKDLPPRFMSYAKRIGIDAVFGDPIDAKVWAKENPLNLALTANPKKLESLRIRFDAGKRDRYGFAPTNEALHNALQRRKVEHTWELIPNGGHAWGSGFSMKSLEKSLKFVAKGFQRADAAEKGRAGLQGLLPGKGGGKDGDKGGSKD